MLTISPSMLAEPILLILGDSLSAGYRLPAEKAWVTQLANEWQNKSTATTIINASISGSTTEQALARLPALLQQYKPNWVLIELGANNGLQGLPVEQTAKDLNQIISLIQQAGTKPLLMQIRIPPNYGKRYTTSFQNIYPKLAEQNKIPLLPFFMEQVVTHPEWIQQDGIHPTEEAQPYIAGFMAKQLAKYIN